MHISNAYMRKILSEYRLKHKVLYTVFSRVQLLLRYASTTYIFNLFLFCDRISIN